MPATSPTRFDPENEEGHCLGIGNYGIGSRNEPMLYGLYGGGDLRGQCYVDSGGIGKRWLDRKSVV